MAMRKFNLRGASGACGVPAEGMCGAHGYARILSGGLLGPWEARGGPDLLVHQKLWFEDSFMKVMRFHDKLRR